MLERNFRAFFRLASLLIMSGSLYAVWSAGRFFAADERSWRKRMFSRWATATANIVKMKIEVRGTLPPSPFFLVSNHLSYLDIAAFGAVVECFFVAKSEVAGWFLIGRQAKNIGTVFINRQNRRDIRRAAREIFEKIENGENPVIFPEGTSSRGEKVLPFKSSFLQLAAETNLPVSYASISYRTANESIKPGESICWWGDADFFPHLWRLFQIEAFTATINFGDETIQNPNRKELADRLQTKVSESFTPVL